MAAYVGESDRLTCMHGITEHKDIERVLFSEDEIAAKVEELGARITADYSGCVERGEEIELVGLLRGSAIFMADLARAIKLPVRMDYMCVSSYGNGAQSSGMVRITKDLDDSIEGRHVIIVEDVLDTGLTLKFIGRNLSSRNPASLQTAVFLQKNVEGQEDLGCKYVGFTCEDEFVVGYGLDYAQRYRNLTEICVLRPEVYEQ